ncbi:site-specific integrase [Zoogloea sp.]|uniref:site-specific integrase n=1 Tax=Zoogloea sp. TaxID=49181 RepID=UPI0035B25216
MATIRERAGRWQAIIKRKGYPQQSKTFDIKKDAEKWARQEERAMDAGTWADQSAAMQTTLAEALVRYEKEVTSGKKGADTERVRITKWKRHKLAQKALGTLKASDFAGYRDARLKDGAAAATVRLELAIISNLFNVARKEWSFEGLANPIEAMRLPTSKNARNRLFLDGEEARLLQALAPAARGEDGRFGDGCANPLLRPLVQLALATAMRRGELLALRWENIRLADRVAHLTDTKNGHSRDVPLSSAAAEVLRALPRAIRGPVFPITPNAVKLGFVRAVERARKRYEAEGGKDERMLSDLHFHDLRHIAVTALAEKLPNIVELAAVSGHQDVRMLRRYYHPKAEDLARKLG